MDAVMIPLSQCSMPVPFTTIRDWFNCPAGLACFSVGPKNWYKEPDRVLALSLSGCDSSSIIWYSNPDVVSEKNAFGPGVVSPSGVGVLPSSNTSFAERPTKYFTPLLPPGAIFHSKVNSKFR